ncbi:response regulator transcription factor [Aquimarina longa]|uniref:response regulator transcription factor n=1 Tax=Aquimarina longa TaxID=1080221 RepID=UPI00078421E3|nr:response regulator transcription factor [Aquimarina longa]
MLPINIIVVDDHHLVLNGLKASLEKYRFINTIHTFTNVKKAISFIYKNTIDLVITDISMPEINGIEFIRKIKQHDTTLKILVISMFKPLHYEKNFYDGYLFKDTDITIITEAIQKIVYEQKTFFFEEISNLEKLSFSKSIVTKREKEIIQLIAKEFTVSEIAEQLFISKHTVETHKKNIFYKLQIKTNVGLIKKAFQLGYIS